MTREVTIWLGNELKLDDGETIEEVLEQIRDGTLIFEGGPNLIRITEKVTKQEVEVVLVDEDY